MQSSQAVINTDEAIDEFEVADFQKLLKKFELRPSIKASKIYNSENF